MVIHKNVKYTSYDLKAIGNKAASLWGGSCISFEVDSRNKKIVFHCVEHGEEFSTEITYDDLQQYK